MPSTCDPSSPSRFRVAGRGPEKQACERNTSSKTPRRTQIVPELPRTETYQPPKACNLSPGHILDSLQTKRRDHPLRAKTRIGMEVILHRRSGASTAKTPRKIYKPFSPKPRRAEKLTASAKDFVKCLEMNSIHRFGLPLFVAKTCPVHQGRGSVGDRGKVAQMPRPLTEMSSRVRAAKTSHIERRETGVTLSNWDTKR